MGKNESKTEKTKREKKTLSSSLPLPPSSTSSVGLRPLVPLFSLRRPATMSKTIALFDVDGTLTVPRKVRTRNGERDELR